MGYDPLDKDRSSVQSLHRIPVTVYLIHIAVLSLVIVSMKGFYQNHICVLACFCDPVICINLTSRGVPAIVVPTI